MATASHHEEHEALEGKSPLPWVRGSKLFLFFVNFVVQELSTMKSTKSLKEIMTLLWTREIEALLFFMSFMVDSLDWRLVSPISQLRLQEV